jgi:cation/acetate symporter
MIENTTFFKQLQRYYSWYTLGFIVFVGVLAGAEQLGLSRNNIGYVFLFATIALYAGIGVMSRTVDVAEYYVAGRRVPALFNGMATGADWVSAASFISLAGTLYLQGFDGLAFIMGWTGGYCLVAFLIAPYLRKFGQFTIPDFLGARYGGNFARGIGVFATILCSFTYVVAQIYGVGLITSRLMGVSFEVGVFAGLAGILVCSFMGGMRAVTWTQVAQYIILIVAYLVPVVWLAVQQTGIPIPQWVYGGVLEKLTAKEALLINDPKELEVRGLFAKQVQTLEAQLAGLPASWETGRSKALQDLETLKSNYGSFAEIKNASAAVKNYPKNEAEAKIKWTAEASALRAKAGPLSGLPRHAEPYQGKDEATRDRSRKNFIALVLCLMLGTASLPHILMRFYTTPTVKQARESVFWSLFFIMLIFISVPALAVLFKYDVFTNLVGSSYANLPAWASAWAKVDGVGGSMLRIIDLNADGIVQLAEITINPDIVVLATPEIAGLPYVISGLVAAGGLAAALSTADGLLLTISNALSHDLYYRMIDPNSSTQRRVTISKILLLFIAVLAAYVTAQKPGDILFLVGASFSLAASAFFPALVLGVFWKRANKWGAIAGMAVGLSVCIYYYLRTYPFFIQKLGVPPMPLWWDINPISAGVFGVPAGLLVMVGVSLLTKRPSAATVELIEHIRYPKLTSV